MYGCCLSLGRAAFSMCERFWMFVPAIEMTAATIARAAALVFVIS
jgi:hypothetical protein